MAKDFYALLGVPKKAEEKDIKSAYRKLARKFHPDVNPNDKVAEQKFKDISEAYAVLSDPEKRALYDQYGENWEAAGQVGPEYSQGGGQQGAGYGNFDDIFSQFFRGSGGGGFSGTSYDFDNAEPRDVEKLIEIPLEEIDTGTARTLTYQTMDGRRSAQGMSTIPTTKKVEIKIPAGISDGKKLRVPGKGAAGVNGKAGDLYVTIKWLRHSEFYISGENLEVEVLVPFWTAALGGEVRIATLSGAVTMRIPSGTQSAQSFRLAGKGITRMGRGKGDLYARIKIAIPKTLSAEQKKLLESFAQTEGVTV